MPEDCDLLLRAHERDDRGILVSPDKQNPDRTIVWSSYTWKKSISNIYHPVVRVRFESGDTKTLTLLRGPYRRNSDKAILIPTRLGEYRIEWEESPDLAGSAKQQEKPTKSLTKVPANYSELSEEERKKWTAEAGKAILERIRKKGSEAN
jgi:hypothetical protein